MNWYVVICDTFATILFLSSAIHTRNARVRVARARDIEVEGRAYREAVKTEYEEFESYVDRWYGNRDKWLTERMAETKLRPNADYGKRSLPGSEVEE